MAALPPPIVDGEFPAEVPLFLCPGTDVTLCLFWQSDYGGTQTLGPVDFTGATATLAIRTNPSDATPLVAISTTPNAQGSIVLSGSFGAGTVLATIPKSWTAMLAYGRAHFDLLIQWANGAITEFARGAVIIGPIGIITQDSDVYQYADWAIEWTWIGGAPSNPQPINLTGAASRLGIRATPTSTPDLVDISTTPTSLGGIALGGSAGTIEPNLTAAAVNELPVAAKSFYQQFIDWPNGTTWCWATGRMPVHPGNDY